MVYLDSSAIVKLVIPEPESGALYRWLVGGSEWVSSAIARVEVLRTLRRKGATADKHEAAHRLLERMALVPPDDLVLNIAGEVGPSGLRSLDAIHVATARLLSGLGAFVTYDARQLKAARAAGLPAVSPL